MTEPRPRLARKARLRWDGVEAVHFLLWPERGLRLNPTAAAIVALCDGAHSVAEIVGELAGQFPDAPAARIADDVAAVLDELRRRALITEA